ncbi:MAG: hypothetical protein Q8J66_10765 [Methylotenera sp.]|nr:hypothetical protein [Methylotenera sp.]
MAVDVKTDFTRMLIPIVFHLLCRTDGAKVAVKQRALGGHALYGYSASFMGVFGKRVSEQSEFSHQNNFFSNS